MGVTGVLCVAAIQLPYIHPNHVIISPVMNCYTGLIYENFRHPTLSCACVFYVLCVGVVFCASPF